MEHKKIIILVIIVLSLLMIGLYFYLKPNSPKPNSPIKGDNDDIVTNITEFIQNKSWGPNARFNYTTKHIFKENQPFTIEFKNVNKDVLAKLVASGYNADTFNNSYLMGSTSWNYPFTGNGEVNFYHSTIAKSDLNITSDDMAKGGTYTITTKNV
jgi:hypothetical protein